MRVSATLLVLAIGMNSSQLLADQESYSQCINQSIAKLAMTPKHFEFIAYDQQKGPMQGELLQEFDLDENNLLTITGSDGQVMSRVHEADGNLIIESAGGNEEWTVTECKILEDGPARVFVAMRRVETDGDEETEVRRESTFGDDFEYGVYRRGISGKEDSFRTTFTYLGKSVDDVE